MEQKALQISLLMRVDSSETDQKSKILLEILNLKELDKVMNIWKEKASNISTKSMDHSREMLSITNKQTKTKILRLSLRILIDNNLIIIKIQGE